MIKKFVIQIAVLLIVAFTALYFSFNQGLIRPLVPGNRTLNQTQIKINDTLVKIEVADTAAERSKGLSGRDSLAADAGMLFVFPESKKYQFWMKGMKFPLDLIFIQNSKVVDLIKDAFPPVEGRDDSSLTIYEPTVPIDMLLEVDSGFSAKNNIKVGDQVYLIK